jgi:hypothetical protein
MRSIDPTARSEFYGFEHNNMTIVFIGKLAVIVFFLIGYSFDVDDWLKYF